MSVTPELPASALCGAGSPGSTHPCRSHFNVHNPLTSGPSTLRCGQPCEHSPLHVPLFALEALVDGLGNGGLHQVHVAHHLRGEDIAQLLVEPAVAQVFCKRTTPDSLESDGSWKKESSSMLSECIQESAQHEKEKIRGRYGGSRGRRKVKGMGVCVCVGGVCVWYVCV